MKDVDKRESPTGFAQCTLTTSFLIYRLLPFLLDSCTLTYGFVPTDSSDMMAEIREPAVIVIPEGDVPRHETAGDDAPPRQRVASLDVFRGLTIALMVLVDDAGGEWPGMAHAPWNGRNLADFVMPFFLFIVGLAIPLALKRVPDRFMAIRKVIIRALKLLFWGILLQGGYSHAPDKLSYGVDMRRIRWCGILQRIALAYLAVSLVEIFTKSSRAKDESASHFSAFRKYSGRWSFFCLVLQASTVNSPYEGPVKADTPTWCYAPFEPEGILSSISAILSTIIGVHFGHVLVNFEVDVWGVRLPFLLLKWIGMNAMLVYVMAAGGIFEGFINGWYYADPHNTWVYWIRKHVFIGVWHSQRVGILFVIFAEILLWAVVSGILHRLGLYWKL